MATFNVSSAVELSAALASAHAGDTILLASGSYGDVTISNISFSSHVTIESADPTHPAKLLDLTINHSSGLTLINLELDGSSAKVLYPFQVLSSSDIDLSHLWIHGSLDGNPTDDPNLLIVRNSSNVTVAHSNFEQGSNGLSFLDDDHLQFVDNSFHDLNTDGIHGGGSSYVTISGNSFTNFYPTPGGNHPDAIQFWTTNTTTAAHDIVVTDNVIVRGSGGPMQGIFITDQVGNLPYSNVTISGNMLAGTMFNGIMVQNGLNVTISDNTVAGFPDMKSWIRLEQVNGGLVTNNIAGDLIEKSDSNLTRSSETQLVPTAVAQAMQYVTNWLAAHADIASIYNGSSVGIDLSGTTTTGTTSGTTGSTNTGGTSGGTSNGTGGGTGAGTTTGGTSSSGSNGSGSTDSPKHFPKFETKIPLVTVAATDKIAITTKVDDTHSGLSHSMTNQFVFSTAGERGRATSADTFAAADLNHSAAVTQSFHDAPVVNTFAEAPVLNPIEQLHAVQIVEHLFS